MLIQIFKQLLSIHISAKIRIIRANQNQMWFHKKNSCINFSLIIVSKEGGEMVDKFLEKIFPYQTVNFLFGRMNGQKKCTLNHFTVRFFKIHFKSVILKKFEKG